MGFFTDITAENVDWTFSDKAGKKSWFGQPVAFAHIKFIHKMNVTLFLILSYRSAFQLSGYTANQSRLEFL